MKSKDMLTWLYIYVHIHMYNKNVARQQQQICCTQSKQRGVFQLHPTAKMFYVKNIENELRTYTNYLQM